MPKCLLCKKDFLPENSFPGFNYSVFRCKSNDHVFSYVISNSDTTISTLTIRFNNILENPYISIDYYGDFILVGSNKSEPILINGTFIPDFSNINLLLSKTLSYINLS